MKLINFLNIISIVICISSITLNIYTWKKLNAIKKLTLKNNFSARAGLRSRGIK